MGMATGSRSGNQNKPVEGIQNWWFHGMPVKKHGDNPKEDESLNDKSNLETSSNRPCQEFAEESTKTTFERQLMECTEAAEEIEVGRGRKRGRPRKYNRVYSFMGPKKKQGLSNTNRGVTGNATPIKRPASSKEKRKILRGKRMAELEAETNPDFNPHNESTDLALKVLEAGELMGLVPLEDREVVLAKIRDHLSD
ncbi:hypothetical protein DCAR_0623208 [Daucus carota subsp. sativus]|uniref:Uncharacterized protein n=1 Tax=Daucus carota subsp. sativus TaxID=79200 RepID=A0A164V4I6_DAUCS|nr:hypothetical protein DCAR_0623208 [Daucus carota subsp. sativus]